MLLRLLGGNQRLLSLALVALSGPNGRSWHTRFHRVEYIAGTLNFVIF